MRSPAVLISIGRNAGLTGGTEKVRSPESSDGITCHPFDNPEST